jgi:hypothetical protein
MFVIKKLKFMNKNDIQSILVANVYFTKCKFEKDCCSNKTELARKYLVKSIDKVLSERKNNISIIRTSFLNFILIFNF